MNAALADAFAEELEKLSAIGAAVRSAARGVQHGLAAEVSRGTRSMMGKNPGARTVRQNVTDAVKSFAHPVKAFQRGMKFTQRDARNPLGKIMLLGGAAAGMPSVMSKQDPSGEGRSRVHRALEFAGGEAGGIIGSPFGLSGSLTAATMGGVAGNRAGALFDRARRRLQRPAPAMVQPPAQGTPG